jgi:uncharacterized membrane protein YedE/YeeE
VLGIGVVLGTATGLFGAGGGFLAVPALVIFGGLPMAEATGTSLLVITMNSVAGLLGSLGHVSIAWPLAATVSACAVAGSLVGVRLAGRVPHAKLRRAFAGLVAVVGVLVLAERAPEAFGWEGAAALFAVPSVSIGSMLDSSLLHVGVVVTMETFTPVASTLGGVLVGVAATVLLLGLGRIAGVSGIFAGALAARPGETLWRVAFVLGLVAGGVAFARFAPEAFALPAERSLAVVGLAGALVGFGTRLGSGCTSGHGVCGVSRLSPRSLVATLSFVLTGGLTVFVVHHVFGGSP